MGGGGSKNNSSSATAAAVDKAFDATAMGAYNAGASALGVSKKIDAMEARRNGRLVRPVFPTNMKEVRAYNSLFKHYEYAQLMVGASGVVGGILCAGVGRGMAWRLAPASAAKRLLATVLLVPPAWGFGAASGCGVAVAIVVSRSLDAAGDVVVPVSERTDWLLRGLLRLPRTNSDDTTTTSSS